MLNRLTFGPRPGDVARVRALGLQAYLEQQLRPGDIDDHLTQAALVELPTLAMTVPDLLRDYPRPMPSTPATQGPAGMTPAAPLAATRRPALLLMELQAARMTRAVMSQRQLQEVMVDFWFNHFNVFVYKADVQWYLTSFERDAIRPHALGRFSEHWPISGPGSYRSWHEQRIADVVAGEGPHDGCWLPVILHRRGATVKGAIGLEPPEGAQVPIRFGAWGEVCSLPSTR